ncbi:hypothetical protein CFC35_00110 [Streptomyces sp. FBKL.4005]|nr:hypothetical protein CFC35_00110 [Streptomyces sp. FBKL.4005]BCM64728.1 hypothetical protein EASAB2608_00062 [Streptomyces sp. EAS-AB2608]
MTAVGASGRRGDSAVRSWGGALGAASRRAEENVDSVVAGREGDGGTERAGGEAERAVRGA